MPKEKTNHGFYRIYDPYSQSYLHTGYNSASVSELCRSYYELVKPELDDEDVVILRNLLKGRDYANFLSYIKGSGYIIENSPNKFEEHKNWEDEE